jgi:hypothetical protein
VTTTKLLRWTLTGSALAACGTTDDAGPAEGGNHDAATEAASDSTTASADASPDDSSSGDDTGAVFIVQPDGGGSGFDCDLWGQDCVEGEKCMPWANDGGGAWNAARCSPLDPNPAQPGDECTVQGSGVSGIDNCALGAMCWNVDPETNIGVCAALCKGSQANPICEDPMASCTIANDGALILCLQDCNPLLMECQNGEACYPVNDGFQCAPDVSGDAGLFGDPCGFINVCDPGLFCAAPDSVPDCEGATGCCSSFCDIWEPDASANCPGAAGGQECVPAFDEGQATPDLENLGACAIPV